MSKSFKYKNEMYLDTKGIVHNKKILSDILYPVGSIYLSVNSISPKTLFGGTWEQIKDKFLLACGDKYNNGLSGGESSHTLIMDEIPSHNHQILQNYGTVAQAATDYVSGESKTMAGTKNAAYLDRRGWTAQAGGGKAHNNMPPYLAVYIWKRTA